VERQNAEAEQITPPTNYSSQLSTAVDRCKNRAKSGHYCGDTVPGE